MNDDQLKREIEDALSVEPSPQFAAQVRARIAESPQPSRFWIRWSVAAAAGLAAAAVVTLVFFDLREPGFSEPVKVATPVHAHVKEAPLMPVPEPTVTPGKARKPSSTQEPEVVIDPREVAGFRKFVEGVQEDRIDLTKLIELQQAAAKPAPVEEIALMPIGDLTPIVIESLSIGTRRIEGGNL